MGLCIAFVGDDREDYVSYAHISAWDLWRNRFRRFKKRIPISALSRAILFWAAIIGAIAAVLAL
jgi:hypothetical protein